MKRGEQIRNLGLAATLFTSVLVLGKVLVTPNRQFQNVTYTFPEQIPLENWQFNGSAPLGVQRLRGPALITSADDLSIAGRTYRYSRNGQQLDIEVRYFVDGTYVDVTNILRDLNLQRIKPEMTRQESAQGSYVRFTKSGLESFSACIPPTDKTTASEADFRGQQNRPQVIASSLLPWLLGFSPLRDLRCVWTRMSIRSINPNTAPIPSVNAGSQRNEQLELEQAWQHWVQWWRQHYPPVP